MRLARFLITRSPGRSAASIVTGIVAGAAISVFMAVIAGAARDPAHASQNIAIGAAAVYLITNILSQTLLNRIGSESLLRLRVEFARNILALPLRRQEELGTHRFLAVLTDDVNQIGQALANLPAACVYIATLLASLVYLGWAAPWVALAWMLVAGLGSIAYHIIQKHAQTKFVLARKAEDELVRHVGTLLEGAKELRMSEARRERFLREDFEATAQRYSTDSRSATNAYSLARGMGEAIFHIFLVLLVFFLPQLLNMEVGIVPRVIVVLLFLLTPLIILVNLIPLFHRAEIALCNVDEVGLQLKSLVRTEPCAPIPPAKVTSFSKLEIQNIVVGHSNADGTPGFTVGPLDFTLSAGELVFLTGGNGSGKTTLAKALCGLYPPMAGQILVNGIHQEDPDAYCQLFSTVFSDFHLLDPRIHSEAPLDSKEDATLLTQLGLAEKLQIKEGRFSTAKLSAGQRRRLALFLALREDHPILLLDEMAADQDPAFRRWFYENLLPELKSRGKTVFAITHDDRYFNIADRILNLEEGKWKTSMIG